MREYLNAVGRLALGILVFMVGVGIMPLDLGFLPLDKLEDTAQSEVLESPTATKSGCSGFVASADPFSQNHATDGTLTMSGGCGGFPKDC